MAAIEVIDGENIELFIEEFGIQIPNAETVYTTTDSYLDRANGGLQVLNLLGDSVLDVVLVSGQSMTVMIDLQGYTLDTSNLNTEASFILDPAYKNLVCIFNLLGINYMVASGRFSGGE
jgi:hypothetical protein